jgi:hypothetical protein
LTYPSEKYEFVSWDDDIPNWMEKKTCSKPPTNQTMGDFSHCEQAARIDPLNAGNEHI